MNEVTGYHEVERLKASVASQESALSAARTAAQLAKKAYDDAVSSHSTAQRDVNALLERKHSWTDQDVLAFTKLVREDHASTAAVSNTSEALKEAEAGVDKAFTALTSAILQRYHEEQVWSDKIRSVATWANVGGLIFNFIIFIGAIAIVEPWKRKRLVERMEERMEGMIVRIESQVDGVRERLDGMIASTASEPVLQAASGATDATDADNLAKARQETGPATKESASATETPAILPVDHTILPPPMTATSPLSKEFWRQRATRLSHAVAGYKWLGDDNQLITSALGAVAGAALCAAFTAASAAR